MTFFGKQRPRARLPPTHTHTNRERGGDKKTEKWIRVAKKESPGQVSANQQHHQFPLKIIFDLVCFLFRPVLPPT